MSFLRGLLASIPYLWIIVNMILLVKSYLLNGYELFGEDQWKLLEHVDRVYPFFTTNIAHYDISEFIFSCIVPIYLYILIRRLISSIFAN